MTNPLITHLLRLSEHPPATLSGDVAKECFGADFGRLVTDRVIEEIEEAAFWTPCQDCDCPAGARVIERLGGRLVAVCPGAVGNDVEVDIDDARRFVVDEERLVCACLGVDAARICQPYPGLWGHQESDGSWIFLTLRQAVAENSALALILSDAARNRHLLLGLPRVSSAAALRLERCPGITMVDISALTPRDSRPLLDLRTVAPPVRNSLHVDVDRNIVEVHGRSLSLPTQRFQLLVTLLDAWKKQRSVTAQSIATEFSGRAAKDVVNELKDDLCKGAADKPAVRRWIALERNPTAYRITLAAGEATMVR